MEHLENLGYNPETGKIFSKNTGKVFSYPRAKGKSYVKLAYNGRFFQYHNVVWFLNNGPIPTGYTVDHVDGNKLNNKIENLRLASPKQQTYNTRGYGKTSKFKGVDFNKKAGKWFSRIMINGSSIWLGSFDDEILAAKAYEEAAAQYHKEFKHKGEY